MAIRLDKTIHRWLYRSTDLLDYNSAYTIMAWFIKLTDIDTTFWMDIFNLSHVDQTNYDCLQINDAENLNLWTNGPQADSGVGMILTTGTWYHVAMVRTDISHIYAYVNGSLNISVTAADQTGRLAIVEDQIGAWDHVGDWGDSRYFAIKAWQAALTAGEIANEVYTIRPRRLTGIYGWWPCFPGDSERLVDYSGNGRNWSANDSLTDEDPGPISFGVGSIYVGTVSNVIISGTVCWGHVTGVTETNVRTFAGHWTGTGSIVSSGDSEAIVLNATEYMESEVVNTSTNTVQLLQNSYVAGDNVTLKYRHGATEAACLAATYNTYSAPFSSLGFVQVRLESTL